MLERGLERKHKLLDVGCGSLRFGSWVIPYLDSERYFGIEADEYSLRAAIEYEVPFHKLEDKRPRFLLNKKFEFDKLGLNEDEVDVIVAHAVLIHLRPETIALAVSQMMRYLKPNTGRLYLSHTLKGIPVNLLKPPNLKQVWSGKSYVPKHDSFGLVDPFVWWGFSKSEKKK